MTKIPLSDWLKKPGNSQEKLASGIGVSQTAVSKMLRVGRNILVINYDDGRIEAVEEKQIGNCA